MTTQHGEINPALNDMVMRGQLSGAKLAALARLKNIVDRFADRPYTSAEEALALMERYGARPDVITWGDYFQTEIASRYFDYADEEFLKIVDTVRFDLISSAKIFKGKPESFMEEVERNGNAVYALAREEWDEVEEEAAHLYILRNYFLEMNLAETTLSAEDEAWFQSFLSAGKSAVG